MASMKRVTITLSWQPASWTPVIGVSMILSGFGMLLLTSRSVAELLQVAFQLPYLASGGLGGLGLIGLGAALINVHTSRRLAGRLRLLEGEVLTEAVHVLGTATSHQVPNERAPESTS